MLTVLQLGLRQIKGYKIIIWFIIISSTAFSIYTPDLLLFKSYANFSVQIMFFCLFAGLLFLILDDTPTMFISFICCSLLCLNLRTRLPFYATQLGLTFKVAHVNLSNSVDYEQTINTIINSKADVISLQDLNFDWEFILEERLKELYPYRRSYISLGVYSPGILSKHPFIEIDTFQYKNAPNIHMAIKLQDNFLHIINSMTTPPIDLKAYRDIRNHLLKVGEFTRGLDAPTVTLGDYNVVSYSPEVLGLRTRGDLRDSRRDSSPILQSPSDHILYSKHLECVDFSELLEEETNERLGIIGTYQFDQDFFKIQ